MTPISAETSSRRRRSAGAASAYAKKGDDARRRMGRALLARAVSCGLLAAAIVLVADAARTATLLDWVWGLTGCSQPSDLGGRRRGTRAPFAPPVLATAREGARVVLPAVASSLSPSPPLTGSPLLRGDPPPLRGGPLAFLRFARTHGMLRLDYARLLVRWAWLKLRWRGRLQTDGLCFIGPGVQIEIGRDATVRLGRWCWIGHGTKLRAHEGEISIGAKTVLGQECTLSAFQHVSIGRECIVADRAMLIDFDHGVVETERPVRLQGIYKRDVRIGHNVWVGYGACFLRGVTVGDNAVIGTTSVVTGDVPANAVCAGVPARVLRMRDAPEHLRWG